MQLTEKDAEKFLEKAGFNVVNRIVIKTRVQLKSINKKIKFPVVMKASGDIVHKARVGAIRLNILNLEQAGKAYEELVKIPGAKEIMVQETLFGQELIIGLKKTDEFNHVLMFGRGGTHVEEHKDVSFRVLPVSKEDIKEMIKETKIYSVLKKSNINIKEIEKVLHKVSFMAEKNKHILEFDINPLFATEKSAIVADARVLFEK